jgi:hypothetical protein
LNSGRGAGVARMIFALPCSPYYLRDFREHWIAIGLFAVGLGFAIPQISWIKRHEAYWDSVRAKERLKRAEASADKKAKQLGGE